MTSTGLDALLKSIRHESELIPIEMEIPLIKLAQEGDKAQIKLNNSNSVLTKEEFENLNRQITEGEIARNQMIQGNQRLVIGIARRSDISNIPVEDLVQEGNLGLFRAIQKFDIESGNKFGTYATFWIRQNINRYISAHSRAIRIPYNMSELATKYNRVRQKLESKLGREPKPSELIKELGISMRKFNELMTYISPAVSLDIEIQNSNNKRTETIGETISNQKLTASEFIEAKELKEMIGDILDSFDERERDILLSISGVSTENGKREFKNSIAERYGVSIQRMNTEIKHITKKFKEKLDEAGLDISDFN